MVIIETFSLRLIIIMIFDLSLHTSQQFFGIQLNVLLLSFSLIRSLSSSSGELFLAINLSDVGQSVR